jgi:hypothetical protein
VPYSAPALGHGMRLRSRRERSDRPRASTVRLALIAAIVAALIGFLSSYLRAESVPLLGGIFGTPNARVAVPAPQPFAAQEQRFADILWSIHTRVEQSVARVGLGAAFYKSQEIDRAELRQRLAQGLASYRLAEAQIEALEPPPTLRESREQYLVAVRLFQASAMEMLKMYEDGDEEHLAAALPLGLDGTTKLQEVGGQFWPDAYPPQ